MNYLEFFTNIKDFIKPYSTAFLVFFFEYFKKFIDILSSFNENIKTVSPEFTFYINMSSGIINLVLILLIFIFILNFIITIFFKNINLLRKLVHYVNLLILTIILILILVKFLLTLKLEQAVGPYIYDVKYLFYVENKNISNLDYYFVFSSSFSDGILLLSIITGIVCLELMAYKNLLKYLNNISLFLLFNFFVTIMVSTNNLLVMFLCFEMIFLPTIYFVYILAYSKKSDKAGEYLLYWTLFGSFMILVALGYIYYNFSSLNYLILANKNFSKIETQLLLFIFLVGFGIKIPLPPFHSWLLKVHVEAPTAFSIFLSGFLVKSSLYCLFMFFSIFKTNQSYFILIGWIFFSLIAGTVGLARVTDIKKLIAWATIQEMSFMLIFLIFKQLFLTHTCILFIILHGLMSTYMFFLVDIIQRRYGTRELFFIKGLNIRLPKLTKHVWFLIVLFSAFPITAKFFIEWSLLSFMVEAGFITFCYILLVINFLGALFFCRVMFAIIYAIPTTYKDFEYKNITETPNFLETQKKEFGILNLLVLLIMLLTFLIYVL